MMVTLLAFRFISHQIFWQGRTVGIQSPDALHASRLSFSGRQYPELHWTSIVFGKKNFAPFTCPKIDWFVMSGHLTPEMKIKMTFRLETTMNQLASVFWGHFFFFNFSILRRVRSGAEERTLWVSRQEVLSFRLRAYHVQSPYTANCNGPTFFKKMMFLRGHAGTFLSFQAERSSGMWSSTSNVE